MRNLARAAVCCLPLFLGALPSADAWAADAGVTAGQGWTATRLDMVVTPAPDKGTLLVEGTLHLRLEGGQGSPGPALALNTRGPVLRFLRVEAPGAVAVLNDSLPGTPAVRVARLRLAKPAKKGSVIAVTFACEGVANGSQVLVRPDVALASWVEGWYPSPLPAASDEAGDPAPVPGTTRFRLPQGWSAVSNGRRVETAECDGRRICEEWNSEEAVMRSFAAGPYKGAEVAAGGIEVGVYSLDADPSRAKQKADVLARALTAMERHFGPYPYPTYAIVEVPEKATTWAASSEQGFILVRNSILDSKEENLPLFAHEAAHGWWGNLVRGKDPGAKFCSESLAEYAAVTAIEGLEGPAAAADFLEFSREGYNPLQSALGYFYMWGDGGDKPMAELAQDKWDHNLSDSKGAWVLHMLRGQVGDSTFFNALRGVIRRYQGQAISLHELERAFTEASPGKGIGEFFRQWTYGKGAPILDWDWWSVDRGKGIEIHVRQVQPGTVFRLPLEVEVTDRAGATARHVVEVAGRESKFHLEAPGRAVAVRLDPDRRLLLWRPAYGPRPKEAAP